MAKAKFPSGYTRRKRDANLRVPEHLTSTLIGMVNDLPSNPKYDYLKSSFLQKFVSDDTDPAEVRRSRAITKWLETEDRNSETNERLLFTHEEYNILPRVTFKSFVTFCQEVILQIVGEVPPDEALIGQFTGGASTSRKRTLSHPGEKFSGPADVTTAARPLFESLLEEMPGWEHNSPPTLNDVVGNVLFTVPKKTDIDRCACKEPEINMFMQRGVGNFLRSKLKSVGINLNDQSRNRKLARVGSISGELATLDLSAASDSVTSGLVQLLMPVLWYGLLDDLRSSITVIDGEPHRNEMFSSMGNGFTFELETLLFYAIARTTAYFCGISGVISVYGDDIIVPTALAQDLIYTLGFFGFQVNEEKSFFEGPFRESCGGHYFNGLDITPIYLRKPMERLTDVILMANSFRNWARLGDGIDILDPYVEPIWRFLSSFVPKRFWGAVFEDTVFNHRLVSYERGGWQLMEDSKSYDKGNSPGYYVFWLNTVMGRDVLTEAVTTSEKLVQRKSYVARRASPWRYGNSSTCVFPFEVGICGAVTPETALPTD